MSSSDQQFPDPTGLGYRIDYVYYRASRAWQTVRVPGSHSWARGTGSWLAYVVAEPFHGMQSPGKEERRRSELTQGHSVDEIFLDTLFLYNSATGKSYQLDTGQGDSEPLLVSGDKLYYRVNDSIYMATIGAGAFHNSTLVATDSVLSQAHWAFMGR